MVERRRGRASLLEAHVRPHSILQFVRRTTGGMDIQSRGLTRYTGGRDTSSYVYLLISAHRDESPQSLNLILTIIHTFSHHIWQQTGSCQTMHDNQATDGVQPVQSKETCLVPSPVKFRCWMECTLDFGALGLTLKDVSPALLMLCAAASHGDLRNYTGSGIIGIDANTQLTPIRKTDDLVDCLVPIEPDFDLESSVSQNLHTLEDDLHEEAQRHHQHLNVMSAATIRHIVILEENNAGGKSPKWMQQLKAAGQTDELIPTTVLHCILDQGLLSVRLCIGNSAADGARQTQSVVDNFLHLLVESLSHPQSRLLDVVGGFLPASPTASIPDAPPFWEVCVQKVIQDQCRKSPDSLAVDAWDDSLTYRELDELTDRLARALMLLGIGPERFVPICMEKSQWTTVAILAVIKSGGAFSLLDPAHPLPRLTTGLVSCSSPPTRLMLAFWRH